MVRRASPSNDNVASASATRNVSKKLRSRHSTMTRPMKKHITLSTVTLNSQALTNHPASNVADACSPCPNWYGQSPLWSAIEGPKLLNKTDSSRPVSFFPSFILPSFSFFYFVCSNGLDLRLVVSSQTLSNKPFDFLLLYSPLIPDIPPDTVCHSVASGNSAPKRPARIH